MSLEHLDSILESLSSRLRSLEMINRIPLNPVFQPVYQEGQQVALIKHNRHKAKLTLFETKRAKMSEYLYQFARLNKNITVNCYTVPRQDMKKIVETINLKDENVIYQTNSNGTQCNAWIYHADMKYQDEEYLEEVIVKFRELKDEELANKQMKTLTEVEATKMLLMMSSPNTKDFFPHTYFIGDIVLTNIQTQEVTKCIEFVGMEQCLDGELLQNLQLYRDACNLIYRFHRTGYVHGDTHRMNFMQVQSIGERSLINNNTLIFIDQDRVQALPRNPAGIGSEVSEVEFRAVRNYMMLQDYLLLLWHVSAFSRILHMVRKEDLTQQLVARSNFRSFLDDNDNPRWERTPWWYARAAGMSVERIPRIFKYETKKDGEKVRVTQESRIHKYMQRLADPSVTEETFRDYFLKIFASREDVMRPFHEFQKDAPGTCFIAEYRQDQNYDIRNEGELKGMDERRRKTDIRKPWQTSGGGTHAFDHRGEKRQEFIDQGVFGRSGRGGVPGGAAGGRGRSQERAAGGSGRGREGGYARAKEGEAEGGTLVGGRVRKWERTDKYYLPRGRSRSPSRDKNLPPE